MKKVLILILAVIIFFPSCSNDGDDSALSPETGTSTETDTYVFSSIKYSFQNGDGVKESQYTVSPVVYANNTSSEISVFSINPVCTELKQRSQFFPDHKPLVNTEKNDSVKIGIPYNLDKNPFDRQEWFNVSSPVEWTYSESESVSSDTTKITDKIRIAPNKSLKLERVFIKREIQASYKATFIGEKTGAIVEISGKWKGIGYSTESTTITDL